MNEKITRSEARESALRVMGEADRERQDELRRPTDPVELATDYHVCFDREIAEIKALSEAGWTPEYPDGDPESHPFAWRWRRPGKRPGRAGRLFPSTGQAFNALRRESR